MSKQKVLHLVEEKQLHSDIYTDPKVFEQEMATLFHNAWIYVGHESQVPNTGDYISTRIGNSPVLLVRDAQQNIHVLMNRCAHKGARLVNETKGNLGKMVRCPYHAWTYRLDGSLLSIPMKREYEGTGFETCPAAAGLSTAGDVAIYRGFVFARLSPEGVGFYEYFGDVLQALDAMADSSPVGELEVAGGSIRSRMKCNWKFYLENVNDTVHPISTHESAYHSAEKAAERFEGLDPLSLEQLLPFGSNYDFYSTMGVKTFRNGHSILGTNFSIHTGYADVEGYKDAIRQAHGKERATEVLNFTPQNVIFYPSMAAKGSPQIIRVLRPVSVDETLLEVWVFQPKGASEKLLQRGLNYSRLVYSPMSVVAHDDIHLFESQQRNLQADGNKWINLYRQFDEKELEKEVNEFENANNELVIRNQYRAWKNLMQEN
ncbi:aromatic ring-hydroxylating dioxygenase subunit alpha [Paenalcaligenes hermetiae]|uniref:Rieske 2Fe-2S domain-containing protein n=1 Tax=Paenalcaligenes hermetiae TaxID=1157987 RepID=A0ABP9M895_9BURK